jgi:NAD(P)-dependent dehydrogenase (short-subunit alcohol dehydrogenase family)
MSGSVGGKRVLVVGASSGIGWAIGVALGKAGARAALVGRRRDRVEEAAAEAGNGALGIAADVRDEGSCAAAVAAAVRAFGGLDAVVYCAAVSPLVLLKDASAEMWDDVVTTNVVGAALITKAALPHLADSMGRAIYLSSESVLSKDPWPGLGPYVVSKAALDKLVDGLRSEHPEIAFTRFVVGACGGADGHFSEFASSWDQELFGELYSQWVQTGRLKSNLVDIEDLTDQILGILASGADLETIIIRPRS